MAQNGKDLIIAREYITHGMRARASELATEWLGPRTEREIVASLTREVTQERWTGLDAAIRQGLTDGLIDVNTWTVDARLNTMKMLFEPDATWQLVQGLIAERRFSLSGSIRVRGMMTFEI